MTKTRYVHVCCRMAIVYARRRRIDEVRMALARRRRGASRARRYARLHDAKQVLLRYYSRRLVNMFLDANEGRVYTARGFLEAFRGFLGSRRKRRALLARYDNLVDGFRRWLEELYARKERKPVYERTLEREGYRLTVYSDDNWGFMKFRALQKTLRERCEKVYVYPSTTVDLRLYRCRRSYVLHVIDYSESEPFMYTLTWLKDFPVERVAMGLVEGAAEERCCYRYVLEYLRDAVELVAEEDRGIPEELVVLKTVLDMLS